MLENFTETLYPDNRPLPIEEEQDSITRGATCIHIFELPFPINDGHVESLSVIYKQGIKVPVLTKTINIIPVVDPAEYLYKFEVELTPEDTILFEQNLLDVYVQLKLEKDRQTLYNTPIKLALNPTLDNYPNPEGIEE